MPISVAAAGFAPDLAARFDQALADKRVWNLHGVVVVRKGRLVLERYFPGEDRLRGRALGRVTFDPDTLHDLRSVSKGIVGLLYGIALAEGKVPPPAAARPRCWRASSPGAWRCRSMRSPASDCSIRWASAQPNG